MGIINRQVMPTYRQSVPSQLQQAVPAIYMGMRPLPIGKLAPVKPPWPPKEDKVANTTSIRGISLGSVSTGTEPAGAANRRRNGKTANKRPRVKGSNKQGRNNSTDAAAGKTKKKGNGVKMVRSKAGKFLKKR